MLNNNVDKIIKDIIKFLSYKWKIISTYLLRYDN